jgi:hypothetical protein
MFSNAKFGTLCDVFCQKNFLSVKNSRKRALLGIYFTQKFDFDPKANDFEGLKVGASCCLNCFLLFLLCFSLSRP